MDIEDLRNRFDHHAPRDEMTASLHSEVRSRCYWVAEFFASDLPDGREKSLAITKLEESMMWANAAIARSHD